MSEEADACENADRPVAAHALPNDGKEDARALPRSTPKPIWWCKSHQREATYERADGRYECDPKLGGILLPCNVELKPVPVPMNVAPPRRIGKVKISRSFLLDNWEQCQPVFARMVPVRIDVDMLYDIVTFSAFSEDFDEIPMGEEAPEYQAMIRIEGGKRVFAGFVRQ